MKPVSKTKTIVKGVSLLLKSDKKQGGFIQYNCKGLIFVVAGAMNVFVKEGMRLFLCKSDNVKTDININKNN